MSGYFVEALHEPRIDISFTDISFLDIVAPDDRRIDPFLESWDIVRSYLTDIDASVGSLGGGGGGGGGVGEATG